MKGIIVVDIPERCKYCPFVTSRVNGNYYCSIIESIENSLELSNPISDDEFYSKPDWCPIKPMPQKRNFKGTEAINGLCISAKVRQAIDEACKLGWNSCIDAIIGER